MKLYISSLLKSVESEVSYLIKLLGINKGVTFDIVYTDDPSPGTAWIGPEGSNATLETSDAFTSGILSSDHLNKNGFFELRNGTPDYLSTAFFCITASQERNNKNPDGLGRFRYDASYQYRLDNVTHNLVQQCFDHLAEKLAVHSTPKKSSFFLSHDIDSVYGSWKEDGFNVLKKGRIDKFLSMLFRVAIGKPEWLNIDKILKIESAYDCRSTFYWIVNKGRQNADYRFNSHKIQRLFAQVNASPSENGIHKSLAPDSFSDEITKFGTQPLGNRYHYLKFNLPGGFDVLEEAGIKFDASLGFSEHWGFRNSYGLPFNPYNFEKKKPYAFVEAPLHIMDRTFFTKRMPVGQVEKTIFDFFEKNRENCVISILWHNNFFSDYKYKGYLQLYKKILTYIRDTNFNTMSQQEIIEKYAILWP